MIDKITSIFDNYSGKIKNPFIGTIISVWLIHNWRIPFALFNFDKECTMIDKINFIADYFGKQNFWYELISIIGISLLILIFTFILLAISRALTEIYYKVIESNIITKIDEKAIYTKEEKDRLETRISNLNSKIESRDTEILKLEANITKINLEKNNELKLASEESDRNRETIYGLQKSLEPFKYVLNDFAAHMPKLTAETLRELATVTDLYKTFEIKDEKDIKFLVNHGILYVNQDDALKKNGNYRTIYDFDYRLTGLGRLFSNYMRDENNILNTSTSQSL